MKKLTMKQYVHMSRDARDALFFDMKLRINAQRRKKKTKRININRRKFPCAFCEYSATFRGNLARHVKRYHQ